MTVLEVPADITRLEQSVAELWSRAREQHCDETLTRALTLNLVAVTDRAHEAELATVVERLLVRHPCRLFLVVVDGDGGNGNEQDIHL